MSRKYFISDFPKRNGFEFVCYGEDDSSVMFFENNEYTLQSSLNIRNTVDNLYNSLEIEDNLIYIYLRDDLQLKDVELSWRFSKEIHDISAIFEEYRELETEKLVEKTYAAFQENHIITGEEHEIEKQLINI